MYDTQWITTLLECCVLAEKADLDEREDINGFLSVELPGLLLSAFSACILLLMIW